MKLEQEVGKLILLSLIAATCANMESNSPLLLYVTITLTFCAGPLMQQPPLCQENLCKFIITGKTPFLACKLDSNIFQLDRCFNQQQDLFTVFPYFIPLTFSSTNPLWLPFKLKDAVRGWGGGITFLLISPLCYNLLLSICVGYYIWLFSLIV